ncbi:MAG: thioredoxin family protein [Candidatus Sumerlaeaceae bacterium]|nr:thioredoxin family protein [Candidatus Sumerlaeaceae bacterium]
MKIRQIAAAAAATLALAGAATAQDTTGSVATLKVGEPAPAFALKDASGKEHKLADYKGKVVVLEWTNPQCPFVVKHYKNGDMQALAKKYQDKGVVWLAVNSSHFNTPEDSQNIAKEWKIEHPVLQDPDGKVGKAYGARTTPHMFVIDKDGNLAYQGAIDSDSSRDPEAVKGATNYVAAAVDALLEGKPVENPATKPYGCSVKYKAN